ncbi:reverse transcriptase domain-containing protein [Tanacetum coccineum]
MPRDCLRIIESKSKVRNSRNKPVVAKVSTSTSTSGISSDVAELKDMVKESLLLDLNKFNLPLPTPVKEVEKVVLIAPQLTTTKETPVIEPQFQIKIDLPVFLPLKTIIMCKIKETIRIVTTKIEGILIKLQLTNPQFIKVKYIDLRLFNLCLIKLPPISSSPQNSMCIKDFQAYVKANDAVMRNMQTQGQNMQNQLTNLTDMLSKFVTSNTASTSGTLPSNTVTNPKEDLKGITTRRWVDLHGDPRIHTTSSPKVVEREPEVTKDTMPPTNNGSTEDVQPSVVPVVHHESISEPVNAPVSASRPNQKASIPFPSRRNDERRQKLSEMARTPLNENCSAVILNKLPKKLGDPGRFLIPCEFSGINTCNALADLGASINLMPYSVWKNLSLPELTPTCMTLELADRSILEKTPTPNRNNSQEVLGFSNVISSGNPTPYYDPIISTVSPTLTPFGDSDFLLFEEADSFLAIEDDPTSPEVDPTYYDPDGDILLLEAILNSDPSPPPPKGRYFQKLEKRSNICEANYDNSSVNEPHCG